MSGSMREQVLRGQFEGQREDARGGGAEGCGGRRDGGVWDVRSCAGMRVASVYGEVRGMEHVHERV